MATRLKPAITKVALVDDGANPDADFVFYKASTVGKGLMVNDLRERLSAAVRDKFATADDDWTYVDDIDLDESSAIYSQDDRFYRVGYSLDANDDVTLSGDSIEVERQVEYLPVGKASKPHKKEAGMADDIKKNLDEATARIAELEAERTALDELTNDDLAALKGFEIAKVDPQVEVLKGLPENVRKRLEELSSVWPLTRDEDPPHVYWNVPKGWFPGGVLLEPDAVAFLLRVLVRVPPSRERAVLLAAVAVHIVTSVQRARENAAARPQRYAVYRTQETTLTGRTMMLSAQPAHRECPPASGSLRVAT